ncbi:hypothetical protein [Chryseobacterium sp. ISL-6]|uniref:hypothetical protein n=1 Tax=Chryseobacterium sp. ISL-6 TaxID=2819143 RepID=UPI001BE8B454|nr:hypothetical protein [Chryseobacterium sp. ISL-6]MBT2620711.1 hypothetical protein [Chryseobacterium sp. ISL-6]
MKNIIASTIIFSIAFTGSCNSQKNTENNQNKSVITDQKYDIEKIELTEQTRGTNKKTTFTPTAITTLLNETSKVSDLSANNWKSIVKEASLIDLNKISSYPSPTTGRFSDRALSSTIIITHKGKTFQSSEFDAGTPPKELEALYQLLKK